MPYHCELSRYLRRVLGVGFKVPIALLDRLRGLAFLQI